MHARCAAAALFALAVAAGVYCVNPQDAVLQQGASLRSNEVLTDGTSVLAMRKNCNLVLSIDTIPLWTSGTAGMGSDCELHLTGDGDLVISNGFGFPTWYTVNRADPSKGPFQLKVANEAAVILGKYDDQAPGTGKRIIIWATDMV